MPKDIAGMNKEQRIVELDEEEKLIVERQLKLQVELDRLDDELFKVNSQQIALDAP